jgi:hypothetical protein
MLGGARLGAARRGAAGLGAARQGNARKQFSLCTARQGLARLGRAWQGKAKQSKEKTMCRHLIEPTDPHRLYGSDITDYAHGAVLPEDAGSTCEIAGHYCDGEDNIRNCAAYTPTHVLCPDCGEEEDYLERLMTRDGRYYCPRCGESYTPQRLAERMTVWALSLRKEIREMADGKSHAA